MGRAPCCDKTKVKRGPWSPEEDATLKNYLENFGTGGNWIALPHKAGLKRCGKSCRLRWLNYLRPDIKHGAFTEEEDNVICSLYCKMGSRWSVIASQLPGRTDNDVKNHWNTKLKKKLISANINPQRNINNNNPTNNSTSSSAFKPKIEAYKPSFSPFSTQNSQEMQSLMDYGLTAVTSQENSRITESSSLVMPMNDHYMSWSGNGDGGGLNDGIPMDFSAGFSYDLVGGTWSQDQTVLEGVNSTNSYENLVNSLYVDSTKSEVNVTNQYY